MDEDNRPYYEYNDGVVVLAFKVLEGKEKPLALHYIGETELMVRVMCYLDGETNALDDTNVPAERRLGKA